jgi:multidrug efflux pump subunit AcrA (membrane-fusion protein)
MNPSNAEPTAAAENTFAITLSTLQSDAQNLVVRTAEDCLAAKTKQRDVRNYMKDVHLKLDPFVESAKRNLASAKDELNKWLAPAEAVDATLAQKVKDYERVEREKAEAEERRINEERRRQAEIEAAAQRKRDEAEAAERRKEEQKRIEEARKAGELNKREAEKARREAEERERLAREQAAKDAEAAKASVKDVKVVANIPTVQGVPSRRNYKFRIVDASRIPRAYLCPDEVKIGQFVRAEKKVGEVIPGVEAYED